MKISTYDYLAQVASKQPFAQKKQLPLALKVSEWIHDHTRFIKITRVFFSALCTVGLASSLISGGVALGTVCTLSLIIIELAFRALSRYGVLADPLSAPVFGPAKCDGGCLHYQGKVPILTLESDDPYKAGKAHGFLLAKQILKFSRRAQSMAGLAEPHQISHILTQIKEYIPKEYLQEMQGIVDGINSWNNQQPSLKRYKAVTLNELLIGQLVPDSLYLEPITQQKNVACTAILAKNPTSGLVFARNMDWPTFGFGGNSLIIHRKYTNGKASTVEVAIPGLVGTLTGMNNHGLAVAMNVCTAHIKKEGIPAAFYNRMVLEQCKTTQEATTFTQQHHPLGSYHMSVADAQENAKSFHFYQGPGTIHFIRNLQQDEPLITTNCTYAAPQIQYNGEFHFSNRRKKALEELYQHAQQHVSELDLEKLLRYGLKLPYVNNYVTAHTVTMHPAKKQMRVAFDNSFAASNPLHTVDTTALFESCS